jgi:hypothetical protein
VRHEEDDFHPFGTDKVNSGVKLHPSRFPLLIALKCSRKHRPERSLCKKLRPKTCIINLKGPAAQMSEFVAGIFPDRSIKWSAVLIRFSVTKFERSSSNLFNIKNWFHSL